jgi:hypothetical protein
VAAFAAQRLRLADEARRRVPVLPVSRDEHWCCAWAEAPTPLAAADAAAATRPLRSHGGSSYGGGSSPSTRPRPLYVVTVAVLTGPRAGEVVGCEQAVARPDGDALLDTLWGAMAFPLPAALGEPPHGPNAARLQEHDSRARRPAGVLLAANLMPHYATVAGALLAVNVACRLESRADAHAHAYRVQQHTAQQRQKARAQLS